jgi:hypothetical protein
VANETHTETSTTETTDQTQANETAATETVGTTAEAAETKDDLGTTALGGEADETTTETTEAEGAEGPPESYELTTPEGFEKLDEAAVAAATPVFKELNLTNEQANKLVPVAADFAKRIVAQRDEQLLGTILDQRKGWLEDAKKDAEIGGSNWDASLGSAAKAFDLLGFPKGSSLRTALNESGFGNHPEMIRLMAKVGKAIGEDSDFVRGQGGKDKKTDAEIFYGPQK